MDDKQRMREIEEVLVCILRELDRQRAEMLWLRAERDRAEERISRLERAVEAQQAVGTQFPGLVNSNNELLHIDQLLVVLAQPHTQN